MFIISKKQDSKASLELFKDELVSGDMSFSPIEEFKIGNFYLFWYSAKPQDQLTIYNNGFVIGKTDFEENYAPHSIDKRSKKIPSELHPLLQSTRIEIKGDEIKITPNGITSIFYSENYCISDHQLLIAKHQKLKPDSILVQVLCGIGYIPGNLSLFDTIHKIPYLYSLNLYNLSLKQVEEFKPRPSNDDKMVERLVDVIPDNKNVSLSISGGMDSRFVLGLLLKKGISPKLVTMKGNELDIVSEIGKQSKLKLETLKSEPVSAYRYTLMTDARIYFRGGNYSQMINKIRPNELIYNGLSILPMNENSFASAWKKPGKLSTIYEDLIDYALIQRIPSQGFSSFKQPISKSDIKSYLTKQLEFGKTYFNFKTRKQWGLWFYHLHRGLTWTPVHLADLSFFVYPVFILSDKKASEIGISSTAYENFNKERLRRINQKLFSDLRLDYSDNRRFESEALLIQPFSKLYNEYFKKFFKRFKHLKKHPSQKNKNWFSELNEVPSKSFSSYFNEDINSIIHNDKVSFNEKRTAVTLNHMLLFLEK